MKQIKNKQLIILAGCLSILFYFTSCSSSKQVTAPATPAEIIKAINNNRWDFSADFAMPSYGRSRNITGGYNVKCLNDTLIVYLPYYGKNNSPSINSGNPLDFRSTNFKITEEDKKGGGWLVTIKPADTDVQSMIFTFYDNGTAQLNVTLITRSGINFSGKVAPAK